MGSDSDVSISGDHRSSKKDLKDRISGMFRRSGTSSRGNSTEQLHDSSKRPIAVVAINNGPPLPPLPVAANAIPAQRTPHLKRSVNIYGDNLILDK